MVVFNNCSVHPTILEYTENTRIWLLGIHIIIDTIFIFGYINFLIDSIPNLNKAEYNNTVYVIRLLKRYVWILYNYGDVLMWLLPY